MSWLYQQSTGEMTWPNGTISHGYSGHGEGRNNNSMQDVPKIGPIPLGTYLIGNSYDDPHLGPCVMHLDATADTNTFGRSLFRLHGDNPQHDASEGCIIQDHDTRKAVSASNDKMLIVVS